MWGFFFLASGLGSNQPEFPPAPITCKGSLRKDPPRDQASFILLHPSHVWSTTLGPAEATAKGTSTVLGRQEGDPQMQPVL